MFWEIRSAVGRVRIVASDDTALFLVTQDNTKFDAYFFLFYVKFIVSIGQRCLFQISVFCGTPGEVR